MARKHTIFVGKAIQKLAQSRGGGSALPGLIAEKIQPDFLYSVLSKLPQGVVVVTGTNGKTTTTKIIAQLLGARGLRVFTNKTGSNFTRGIASSVLSQIKSDGEFPFDVAVIELDEAHAVQFVQKVTPAYVVALNIMRDQLDRFGEIDHTAELVKKVALSASKGLVLNLDDERVAKIGGQATVPVYHFGANNKLQSMFVSDDNLYSRESYVRKSKNADVELIAVENQTAKYRFGNRTIEAKLKLNGVYNFLNIAASIALVLAIDSKADNIFFESELPKIEPAFGRGEKLEINGISLELVLVKNPAGFRLALASFEHINHKNMIVINDRYADGRDMSWLWDVDFTPLKKEGVFCVSGIRAYDMALRLKYDEIGAEVIESSINKALDLALADSNRPIRIFCTYTAMLEIRKVLSKKTKIRLLNR